MMKKVVRMWGICLSVIFVSGVSCGLAEIGGVEGRDDIWTAPQTGQAKPLPGKSRCYALALDYPEGYDWRRDPEKGTVRCSLVVFVDGSPLMKLPVGDRYEVGADPDMMRMMGGHLYTDYSSDTETVVKRDGAELIRYAGREMIKDILIEGEDIYTLGQSRDGEGFSLRMNGEPVLARDRGYVSGGIQKAGNELCFAFYEQLMTSGQNVQRYYTAVGTDVVQIALRDDVKKVWDVLIYDDHVIYLASLVGIREPVIVEEDRLTVLDSPEEGTVLTCRMFRAEDEMLWVEGVVTDGRTQYSCIWEDGMVYRYFSSGMTMTFMDVFQGSVCGILNSSSILGGGTILRFGEEIPLPQGYVAMGCSPFSIVDGIMHVGLSSIQNDHPLIWKDGSVDTLDINGYISLLSTDASRE